MSDQNGKTLQALLIPAKDLMPDSRAKIERDVVRGPGGNWVWVFCGNCGGPAGRVPIGTGHAFFLCPRCADQWGMIAHELVEPQVEFQKAVIQAQLETHKRVLSRIEVAKLLDDVNDPIGRLIRQGG